MGEKWAKAVLRWLQGSTNPLAIYIYSSRGSVQTLARLLMDEEYSRSRRGHHFGGRKARSSEVAE